MDDLMRYTARITRVTVVPEGEELFSECATSIEIRDEAGGEYIKITQCNEHEGQTIAISDSDEWEAIKMAADKMFCEIKVNDKIKEQREKEEE